MLLLGEALWCRKIHKTSPCPRLAIGSAPCTWVEVDEHNLDAPILAASVDMMHAPLAALGELLGFHRHFYLKHYTVLLPLDISIKEANTYSLHIVCGTDKRTTSCDTVKSTTCTAPFHQFRSSPRLRQITVVELHQAPFAWPLR